MKLKPNLGLRFRVLYAAFGLGLLATPLLVSLDGVFRIILPAAGLLSLVTGATGW